MAQVRTRPQAPPTTIDRFLGVNEDSSGDTQLELGESPNMVNFRLTENYKLRKREGYAELFASLGDMDIQGMWYGKIAGAYHFLFAAGGSVYKHDLATGTNTSIGTLTDAKTFFFAFGDKVYVLNGHEYKSWNGTVFGDVAGYVPLIATATPPTGGGTDYEQINLLTGKKRQWFSGDNTATVYLIREQNVTSVDRVEVAGVVKTVTTDYTVDVAAGKITFVVAPPTGVDNVEIEWTKGTGSRAEITAHKFAMFYGGQNDTRVFVYGDGTNRYYYTGLADGVPSVEYFPALNYREISSDEFAVTDIVRQYDRQIIFTNGGEAWYSYYDPITIDGITVADFPTYPLNDTIGNVAPGQAQIIQNNPYSIQSGVYVWTATNVRDERNVVHISKRVQMSMQQVDLSQIITVDWEEKKEYWLSIGNKVWVYNYLLDAWYKFQIAHEITSFLIVNNEMYIGTSTGQIMKFDDEAKNDNGTTIHAIWEMGFYDFDVEYLEKFLNRIWVSIQPGVRKKLEIKWQTDNTASSDTMVIDYMLIDFEDLNYADWTYSTYYNPQPHRLKVKAKKFVYFKLILENSDPVADVTVLSINLLSRAGGETK